MVVVTSKDKHWGTAIVAIEVAFDFASLVVVEGFASLVVVEDCSPLHSAS